TYHMYRSRSLQTCFPSECRHSVDTSSTTCRPLSLLQIPSTSRVVFRVLPCFCDENILPQDRGDGRPLGLTYVSSRKYFTQGRKVYAKARGEAKKIPLLRLRVNFVPLRETSRLT